MLDLTTLVNGIPLYWYVIFAVGFMALVAALWVGLGRTR